MVWPRGGTAGACFDGAMTLSTLVRGEGRPVIVLPWFGVGAAVAAEAFEPVFAGLSGWRRVYADLPGTGGSAPVAPTSDAVLDVVAELTAGLESFVLAGSSYGGYLAAALARRIPDRVRALLLVCSGVRIRPAERDLSGVLDPDPEPGWLDGVPEDLHEHFTQAIGTQTATVAQRIAAAIDLDPAPDTEYLTALRTDGYALASEDGTIDCDTLILAGRRDRIAGYRDQFALLADCPRASYAAYAEAGHYLPFEQPDHFTATVRAFLAAPREVR